MRSFILFSLSFLLASSLFAINKDSTYTKSNARKSKISFKENKGQIHDQHLKQRTDILYSGNVGGMVYHLKQNGVHYQLSKVNKWKEEEVPGSLENEKIKVPSKTTIHRLDISWPGSNPNTEIITGKPLSGFDNYYLPSCPNGALYVKSYHEITYKKIYDGIDLVFHSKDDALHYDFIVNTGADYSIIKIKIKGAKSISKNENGDIVIRTPLGEIIEGKPIVYQRGIQLEAKWLLKNNELSFDIRDVNPNYELIIDPPVRNWGTYYGGPPNEGEDNASCAADRFGNSYIFEDTRSTVNIATVGAFQTTTNGMATDFFIAKFDESGVRQWGTYYGGSGSEGASKCTTDLNGNIYFCGWTTSSDVSISLGTHQPNYGGGGDALLVKLNTNGIRLWSTFYGGASWESGNNCATDIFGNVYLVGHTSSNNFIPNAISTPGSHQPNIGSGPDAFLVKFDSSGTRLWGTYYGGAGDDYGNSCSPDSLGNIFIVGTTESASSIATTGSFQATINSGTDMFIAKFNSAGSRQWSTYYGGIGDDYLNSCKTDPFGNLIIAGSSELSSSMATTGAFQINNAGGRDAILAQFNTNGNRVWSTYFGSANTDRGYSCSVNRYGDVFLSGTVLGFFDTLSTPNAHQVVHGGGLLDAYLAKFNNNGNRVWCTYYGGNAQDDGYSCSTSITGNVYLAGSTRSTNGIATLGSHQSSLQTGPGSSRDVFLVQFCDTIPSTPEQIIGPANICISNNQNILFYVNYNPVGLTWIAPPGATILSGQGTDSVTVSFGTIGGNISVTSQNACGISLAQTLNITINTTTPILSQLNNTICFGDSVTLTASGGTAYLWNTQDTSSSITVSPNVDSSYTVIVSNNGCDSLSEPISVVVNPTFFSSDTTIICQGDSALIFGSYYYNLTTLYDSLQTAFGCDSVLSAFLIVNPTYSYYDTIFICQGDSILLEGTYQFSGGNYSDTLATTFGCDSIINSSLTVKPIPVAPITNDTLVCLNDGIPILNGLGSGLGTINWYSDPNATILINTGNTYTPVVNTEGIYVYYLQETINACKGAISSISMQINDPLAIINPSETSGFVPLEIFFNNLSVNANSYHWNFGNGDTSNLFSPNYTYNINNSYTVTLTVEDSYGCKDSVKITINADIKYIVTIPNTITPNNDNTNDFWIIDNIQQFPGHTIQIFNRNGSSVFKTSNYQNDWNGQYNGNDLPATTYYYIIDLGVGEKILKGDLSIIREK